MVASLIEITVVVLLVIGLFNEAKIAEFEQKIFSKWRKSK